MVRKFKSLSFCFVDVHLTLRSFDKTKPRSYTVTTFVGGLELEAKISNAKKGYHFSFVNL